ncbi:MAG: polysaccharide biosynthesis/export family protein [Pontixanthobacter sp.]
MDANLLSRLDAVRSADSFARSFGDVPALTTVIGYGDMIDISIWEAPPAVLFGATGMVARTDGSPTVAQSGAIPPQVVGNTGTVTVPFVGEVTVAGRDTQSVERAILARLRGRAHDPQIIVRLVQNDARAVTILGEVANSRRVPLGARGERVLDALASAGGPSRAVDKTTIQIARSGTAIAMPLERVVRDPAQNIRLLPDDVVTVFHQPFSFTALGALSRNAEIPFEGSGLTLAEALGRVGGLRDDRADIRGVFVFRMEDRDTLRPDIAVLQDAERIPVIYRLDLSDPARIFIARFRDPRRRYSIRVDRTGRRSATLHIHAVQRRLLGHRSGQCCPIAPKVAFISPPNRNH